VEQSKRAGSTGGCKLEKNRIALTSERHVYLEERAVKNGKLDKEEPPAREKKKEAPNRKRF